MWEIARSYGMATPNICLLTDIFCCPGGVFCSVANSKSFTISEAFKMLFDNRDYLHDIGDILARHRLSVETKASCQCHLPITLLLLCLGL